MWLVDRLEQVVLVERQTALIMAALGAKPQTIPDPVQSRVEFDRWLNEAPKVIPPERAALLRALGVPS